MFTGIVQAMGKIASLNPTPFGVRLVVNRSGWMPPGGYVPRCGDSICVSGVCLTVVEATATTMAFDVIAETLMKTKLGNLKAGDAVNIEPPVAPNQPMGGHFMQGHVDGVGVITDVVTAKGEMRVAVQPPAELMDYIISKGSIALDGVSLTLASVSKDAFDVALIPTTLQLTTLGMAKVGQRLNIEADILTKTVVSYLRKREEAAAPVTKALLHEAGFTT